MKEIEDLIRALDEWEAADDRASQAATVLSRPAALRSQDFEKLRALERVAAQKLERVRVAVAEEL